MAILFQTFLGFIHNEYAIKQLLELELKKILICDKILICNYRRGKVPIIQKGGPMRNKKAIIVIAKITFWIIIAILGALLGVNRLTGGCLITLRLTALNTFDLLWQFILHCGCVGFLIPLLSIWRVFRIVYPKRKKENK